MRVVTAAFEAGDLRPLLAAVHPEIVWKAASPHTSVFRFGGVHHRREGVLDVTAQIAMDYVFRRFKPREIIETLNLRRPIYRKTASYGHFGRDDADFTWEATDKAAKLASDAGLKQETAGVRK